MLRPDESTAWTEFIAANPRFAGEEIAHWSDGPDPPDVLCVGASGKVIGVELTKWVEHGQVTTGRGRELLENSYLKLIGSNNEPRPEHIARALLYDKSLRMKPEDAPGFRTQLFEFLVHENAKPEPSLNPAFSIAAGYWNTVRSWNTAQGAPVSDFSAYPLLGKFLEKIWIYPQKFHREPRAGMPWILFESPGGAYTAEWMEQAATDNILAKINKYRKQNLRGQHSLGDFDLLCYYCDEALLHNTPIHTAGVGFQQLAAVVTRTLTTAPKVFDRIFLFYPYEDIKVVQVY